MTPALTSSYQSPMRSINPLMIGWEVRGVFLDASKVFDKVWHQDAILKLKQNGISENLLKIIEDFLPNRYQTIVLNSQPS